jgi:hypothetical protein
MATSKSARAQLVAEARTAARKVPRSRAQEVIEALDGAIGEATGPLRTWLVAARDELRRRQLSTVTTRVSKRPK